MSVRTITYAVTVQPGGATLDVTAGQVTLDAGQAPLIQATITVPAPAADVRADLDARHGARVTLTIDDGDSTGTFDLTVTRTEYDWAADTLTLTCASDEALLAAYAPPADDWVPYGMAGSLRSVCGYVIARTSPGAVLQPAGAADVDVTPVFDVTNLLDNPSFEVDASHWTASTNATIGGVVSGGVSGGHRLQIKSAAAGRTYCRADDVPVTPGDVIYAGVSATTYSAQPATNAGLRIQWFDAQRRFMYWEESDGLHVDSTAYPLLELHVQAPARAAFAGLYVWYDTTAAGRYLYIDGAIMCASPVPVPFFDGNTHAAGPYAYAWTDDKGVSPSTRTANPAGVEPDALCWHAGQTGLDFITPLLQAAGLRLVCDGARAWTLRDADYRTPGVTTIRHAVNATAGTDTIDTTTGDWYDAAVARYTWTDHTGLQHTRDDTYAPAGYTHPRVFDLQNTPYPGPGFARYAATRAAGRGHTITASTVTRAATRADQACAITDPTGAVFTGTVQSATFDLTGDETTITARATDTPAGAVILLTGTIDTLTGTIDTL